MRVWALTTVLVLGSIVFADASATILMSQKFKCPVGGQRFEATGIMSTTYFGGRPDGRPITPITGWVPLPECPKNKLIMYRHFSPDEIRMLKVLLATPAYKAMSETESQHYRVAWLEKALSPDSKEYVWYLLKATWEVGRQPEKKDHYRKLFLAVAEGQPADPEDLKSLWLKLRVANSYREMQAFSKAEDVLATLPMEKLSAGLPQTEQEISGLTEETQLRWYFVSDVKYMRTLIDRGDANVEPLDMSSDVWRKAEACYFLNPKTAFEARFCSDPEILAVQETEKDYYEAIRAERPYYDGPVYAPPPPPKRLEYKGKF